MGFVVSSLFVTSRSAETRVDGGRLAEFEAQVRPRVGAVVERSIHDGSVEVPRLPAFDGPAEFIRIVAIAARDGGVELSNSTAAIGGGFGVDAGAPEGTFDVGEGWGVGPVAAGVEGWVALGEDVESEASGLGGAFGGAGNDVVAFGGVDDDGAEMFRCVACALEVLEGLVVACWAWVGVVRDRGSGLVGSECLYVG